MGSLFFFKKIFLLLLSIPFFFLGLLFLISAFHPDSISQGKMGIRILFGGLLTFAGLIFIISGLVPYGESKSKESETISSQQEPPGQLNVKSVNCPNCGGHIDPSSANLTSEGTLMMKCPYCGGTFLIEEAPKW